MNDLVTGDWLADHLEDVRVVDVRWYLDKTRSGRTEYEAGHIPGAVHLDIDTELSDPVGPGTGRHPLPTPERFAAALGRVGIGAGTPVVAYDDAGGSIAARLWWLLHVLDEPVAVLDGGMAAWPGELTTDVPTPAPADRAPVPWPPHRFRSADQLAELGDATLLDARSASRFTHGDPSVDPRPGHIPGARSAPWQDNLDADGHFKSPEQLRRSYGSGPFVAYCGSGVTACHDLLALHVAGERGLALYPGSWSQWGADPSRSAET